MALLRGRMLDGLVAVLVVWGVSILTLPLLNQFCLGNDTQRCSVALAHPTITVFRPRDPYWLFNRMIWFCAGLLLLTAGLWLARRDETLAEAARGGEA
jgi:hypothetical protein